MDELHPLESQRTSLHREAWGSPAIHASPNGTFTSASSTELRGTTFATVGPRWEQVGTTATSSTDQLARKYHRRLSTGDAQIAAYFEIHNVMELMTKKIFLPRTWLDALHVVRLVVVNCIPSVVCAWVTSALYAVGTPWAPYLPEWSSSMWTAPVLTASGLTTASHHFDAAIGCYFVLIACVAHLATKSFTVGNRLFTFSAGMWSLDPNAPGLWRLLGHNLIATGVVLLLAIASGTFVMELLRFYNVDFRSRGRIQVYVLSAISYAYVLYAEVHLRLKLLRRVLVFLPTPSIPSLNRIAPDPLTPAVELTISQVAKSRSEKTQCAVKWSELMRQLLRAQVLPIIAFHLAFLFLHLAAALSLRRRWEAMMFAAACQLLKLSLQEATKKLQLDHRRQRCSARMIHTVMTVPTICIDAPVRLVFMQKCVNSSSLVSSSLAIVLFEIFFRTMKILSLRYVVSARLARSKIMKRVLHRVNSRVAIRDTARARAEYSMFLDWKSYRMRLHAAEVYADMHGKYISIGVATAVLYTLRSHPRYNLGEMSSSTHIQLLAGAVQLGTGLVVDFVSSALERVQEVPVYESLADEGSTLVRYLRLLMSVLTAINVGVISLFALQPEGSSKTAEST